MVKDHMQVFKRKAVHKIQKEAATTQQLPILSISEVGEGKKGPGMI